ncbi:MAG: HEAT repeat domain-containing protein, partial [Candidatus Cloacimonadales bacterium]|nr:HEAT repeat domain-containing protein [Candidatus Cloacimonadales bacterium]
MLSAIAPFFLKNPQSLLKSYKVDSADKNKIIQRLLQLDGVDELIEIAKKDKDVRDYVILDLLKKHKLTNDHFQYILSWLEASKLQSSLLSYIKSRVEKKHIEMFVKNNEIDPNARRNLKSILTHFKTPQDNEEDKYSPDERYLRLKMILDEYGDINTEEPKQLKHYTAVLENVVLEFIKEYHTITDNHIDFLVEFIKKHNCLEPQNKECFLTIMNIVDLTLEQKLQLVRMLDSEILYEPEFFSCFTNFNYGDAEKIQSILSRPMVNKWIDSYFKNTYFHDLLWLNRFYPSFEWVISIVDKKYNDKIAKKLSLNENNHLTKTLNLTLFEIINNKGILDKLEESSLFIQNMIDSNNDNPSFEIEFYLKALSMIGGEINFRYFAKQINKRPVQNMKAACLDIEKKYLKLKKDEVDPRNIQALIEKEQNEKDNLITVQHFGSFMHSWIENISLLKIITSELKQLLSTSLPDLKSVAANSGDDTKKMICKLIALLDLNEQRPILDDLIKSKNISLKIQVILALKSFGEDISEHLQNLAYSKNVLDKQELVRSLHYFEDDFDEITLTALALDNNALVSELTMNFIASLDQELCFKILTEIHMKIQLKNRYNIVRILASLNTVKVIPVIIQLLRNGDNNLYLEGIKAFAKINHPLSIIILKNMELDKNFVLELERAKALINLGDFEAWEVLSKYFTINHTIIQEYAKLLFIQLAGIEQMRVVQELSEDANSLVAGFAITKLFLYHETEAYKVIDDSFDKNHFEKLYYIAIFFSLLPYNDVKSKVNMLIHCKSLKCRTIATFIIAKNEDIKLMDAFEKEVINMDNSEHKEIITAFYDYPDPVAFNLVKKICMFQSKQNIEIALDALVCTRNNQINDFVKDLWNKSDNEIKKLIIDFVIRTNNDELYQFIKIQTDYVSFDVQAHIYRSIISVENSELAWEKLDEIIRADENDIIKTAIEALAQIEDQKTINILNRYLSSPFEDIQIEVIKALGSTGNPEVIKLISKYTDSSSPRLKIALATALGNLPFKGSLNLLKKLSIDRDEYVKVTADVSIEKLQRGAETPKKPFCVMIDDMLEENTWRLSDDWFEREYSMFYKKNNIYEEKQIKDFIKKNLLIHDDYLA